MLRKNRLVAELLQIFSVKRHGGFPFSFPFCFAIPAARFAVRVLKKAARIFPYSLIVNQYLFVVVACQATNPAPVSCGVPAPAPEEFFRQGQERAHGGRRVPVVADPQLDGDVPGRRQAPEGRKAFRGVQKRNPV